MLVVNLFGVPSSGKSTGAAYVFSKLKMANFNAELVTEYAKDKVWEENKEIFKPDNQLYVFSKQFYRMNRCKDKVDILVTDSPLPLSILYNRSEVLGEDFNKTVMNCFKSFENISFLIQRDKPYNPAGRLQTEEQSNESYYVLENILRERNIVYKEVKGNVNGYEQIVNDIMTIAQFLAKEEE